MVTAAGRHGRASSQLEDARTPRVCCTVHVPHDPGQVSRPNFYVPTCCRIRRRRSCLGVAFKLGLGGRGTAAATGTPADPPVRRPTARHSVRHSAVAKKEKKKTRWTLADSRAAEAEAWEEDSWAEFDLEDCYAAGWEEDWAETNLRRRREAEAPLRETCTLTFPVAACGGVPVPSLLMDARPSRNW